MPGHPKSLDYAAPPVAKVQVENLLYAFIRFPLVGFGVTVLAATVFASLDAWRMALEDDAAPPSMGEKVAYLLIGLGISLLFVTPNRWTQRLWLFWPRLVLHLAVGGWLVWAAIGGVRAGIAGGRSSLIYGASLLFAFTGIALVACLIWSRRIYRDA